ncbi:MAG: gliding motility-associated C-terminal domain-containing protein [Crocinitomicaceae bacterium]|nr:gliding motility-associated C-terminal domain-containing protein [Crocinitomicaceae bacterium]
MKINVENSIKKGIEGYEVPFDPKAWEAMSKRLDQAMPVQPKSNLKWYLGGAAIVAAIASSLFFINGKNTPEKQAAEQTLTQEKTSSVTSSENSNTNQESTSSAVQNATDEQNITAPTGEITANNPTGNVNSQNSTTNTPIVQKTNPNTPIYQSTNPGNIGTQGTEQVQPSKEVSVAEISNMCKNEKVVIENKNDISIHIIDPSGNKKSIKAKSPLSFEGKEEGKYHVVYFANDKMLEIESFNVMVGPNAEFSYYGVDELENGVPTINLKSNAIGTDYEWKLEGRKAIQSGKEAKAHFFNKGQYDVTHIVTGSNGCKTTETKTITVDQEYNLLAMNAFTPESYITAKQTFMPRALVDRNTDFTLVIFDQSGAVVFETNDATNAWNGIDKRNGQMVEANKTFVWKVTLKNPLDGEKPVYQGTVVRQQ